jgi:hypothetical protein
LTDEEHTILPQRIVKPRSRKYKRLPIIVVTPTHYIHEDGTIFNVLDLPTMPSTLFVTVGAGDFIAELDERYRVSHPDSWQWHVTTQEKGIVRPGGVRVAARVTTVVKQFGFKNGNYHKVIDPVVMYGCKLDDIWPGDQPAPVRLMRWGQAVRDFCDENGMEVRPTIGSLGGQFLTDRRFYPNARRKVPRKINDRARENLPGNHYGLAVEPSPEREFNAWYVDQRRAHHYHAANTILPDADNLYAHGRFTDLDDIGTMPLEVTDDFYGLYCLHLQVPKRHHLMWHWIRPAAPYDFVFSNELPLLLDMGYRVNAVIAAWGSHSQDGGIKRYATWASQQLDDYGDAAWLKPLLLATYGTLATRPSWGEAVFRLAKRGQEATVYTGRRSLTGLQVRKPVRLEPGIANVIHRGMIEAAARAESIELARLFAAINFRVLAIYADAVIVQQPSDDRQLPPLPEPWRLKTTLTHLQFINKQAFMSGEMTKIPGVNREIRAYTQRSPGHAPRRRLWNIMSHREVQTDRRI